jgi:hypothetical protein
MKDDFFQVPITEFSTSEGVVKLPILYYDVSQLMAFFWVEPGQARSVVGDTAFEPVIFTNGKCVAGVVMYAYYHTTVGVYNEVGVAIAVRKKGQWMPFPETQLLLPASSRSLAFYVIDLPVTTQQARAAGREIWGYPKFVTDIPLDFDGEHFKGAVMDPDRKKAFICKLEGAILEGLNLPAFDLVTFSELNGQTLRTSVNVRGRISLFRNKDFYLSVGDSGHDMAGRLRSLGLDNAHPFLCAISRHNWQSRLNPGVEL